MLMNNNNVTADTANSMCAHFTCQYCIITGNTHFNAMVTAENTKHNFELIVPPSRINKIEVSAPKRFETNKIISRSQLVTVIFK